MGRLLICLMLVAATGPAHAVDPARGQRLHDGNCIDCHTSLMGGEASRMYTRGDRRVSSLPGLGRQVRRCEQNLGLRWFDDDVADVTAFLNQRFYRFDE